jgi:hypothetical protein
MKDTRHRSLSVRRIREADAGEASLSVIDRPLWGPVWRSGILWLVMAWGGLALAIGVRALPPAVSVGASALLADQAAKAYGEGRYQEAAELYQRLIATGTDGADARYDLGNCLLKEGDLGRAILEYRRALRFNPNHGPSLHNIEVARRLLPARVAPWQPSPWEGFLQALPPAWLDWAVIGLILLGNLALGAILLLAPGRHRRILTGVMIAMFVAAGAAGLLWTYARTVLPSHRPAVVLKAAPVFAGPQAEGAPLATLPEGSEVIQVARAGDWTLVLWGEGRGWALSSSVEAP